LIQDAEGYLYGTTTGGGKYVDEYGNGQGTVFKIDHLGNLIWSSSLDGANGTYPLGGLVRGPNNLFTAPPSQVEHSTPVRYFP